MGDHSKGINETLPLGIEQQPLDVGSTQFGVLFRSEEDVKPDPHENVFVICPFRMNILDLIWPTSIDKTTLTLHPQFDISQLHAITRPVSPCRRVPASSPGTQGSS